VTTMQKKERSRNLGGARDLDERSQPKHSLMEKKNDKLENSNLRERGETRQKSKKKKKRKRQERRCENSQPPGIPGGQHWGAPGKKNLAGNEKGQGSFDGLTQSMHRRSPGGGRRGTPRGRRKEIGHIPGRRR